VFRPGHPIEETDGSLQAILAFDWAIAGFDNRFQNALPFEQRELLRQQGFPKYRILNQSACLELAMRSDIVTMLPASVAAPLVAKGACRTLPFPGEAFFAISAVTHAAQAPSPTVQAFLSAIKTSFAS
jgi:DNA-binding transcriptional LysR family regulator